MFAKLIVGVDGREGGADAVALALTLAANNAEILLTHAFPFDANPSIADVGGYEEVMRSDALKMLRHVGSDPRFAQLAIPDRSPARALHRLAETEDADLIVTGSCHRGVLGRVLLGDVSRAVVHDAPCAVAIAPRGYRDSAGPIRVIGMGLDDSGAAFAAAEFAGALAAEQHAELRLLTAIGLPVAYTPGFAYVYDWPEFVKAGRDEAGRLQAEWIAAAGASVTGEVVEGIPGEELERLSRDVDLLVLGSRGWGAVRRVVLGSTGDRVVHRSACPVVLVPRPGEDGPGERAAAA